MLPLLEVVVTMVTTTMLLLLALAATTTTTAATTVATGTADVSGTLSKTGDPWSFSRTVFRGGRQKEQQQQRRKQQQKQELPVSFYGLNYNTRKGPDWASDAERCKSRSEIVRDLKVLVRITSRIRLLSLVDCSQGELVWSVLNNELSSFRHEGRSMEVWLGLWVGPDPRVFGNELEALEEMLPGMIRQQQQQQQDETTTIAGLSGITVGSEAIYREDVTVEEAIGHKKDTKDLLALHGLTGVPVTIVDIAPVYSRERDLRLDSEIVMTNTFPFWEGIGIGGAVDELDVDLSWLLNLEEVRGKPFVLSEHGWPSGGFLEGVGVASATNQKRYLAESYCFLKEKGWPYYWFTAIDNDWRQEQDPDNTIEGNWGFLTAGLELKEHLRGYGFSCGDGDDGNYYSFGSVDWTIPELEGDETMFGENLGDGNASCVLWEGCEELAGDCCPTSGGGYLGCCRDELFLGSGAAAGGGGGGETAGDDTLSTVVGNGGGGGAKTEAPTEAPTEGFVIPIPAAPSGQSLPTDDSGSVTPEPSGEVSTTAPMGPPTSAPTGPPTAPPTALPTNAPTRPLTRPPTRPPTRAPTDPPTDPPTVPPTGPPTGSPTDGSTTGDNGSTSGATDDALGDNDDSDSDSNATGNPWDDPQQDAKANGVVSSGSSSGGSRTGGTGDLLWRATAIGGTIFLAEAALLLA